MIKSTLSEQYYYYKCRQTIIMMGTRALIQSRDFTESKSSDKELLAQGHLLGRTNKDLLDQSTYQSRRLQIS